MMPNEPSSDVDTEIEPLTGFADFAVVAGISDASDDREEAESPLNDAPCATGRGPRTAASSTSALEDRLKRGAERFQFGALIDGPSRPPRPPKQHVRASIKPPEPKTEPTPMPTPAPQDPLTAQRAQPAAATQPPPAAPYAVVPAPRARRHGQALAAGGIAVVAIAAVAAVLLVPGRPPASAHSSPGSAAHGAKPARAGAAAQSEARSPGLPDPTLTPGERTASAGAAASVAIPETLRRQVLKAYDVGPDDKRTVVCRLVPASLGGATTVRNLFPITPWFADLKARLDAALTQDVNAGRMTAEQAAKEETTDWVQAVHAHGVRNYGLMNADQARQKEQQLRW